MEEVSQNTCPTCQRIGGDLEPQQGLAGSKTYDVSLSSLHDSASSCTVCAFVQNLLAQDPTTPGLDDSTHMTSMLRVDEWGLRFTGQWQGALVIEVYKPGNYSFSFKPKLDLEVLYSYCFIPFPGRIPFTEK